MEKNVIIFDLDGTLLDTLEDIEISFNYALKESGYREYGIEEVRNFVGNGIKKAFERAIGKNNEVEKLIEKFKLYYSNHLYEHTKPYDGITEMLKELKEKKYTLAVVSNKYDGAVKELCKNYFSEYIDVAIGESEEVRRKPNIDGISKAVNELGREINEVIYVGDSEVDIETAKNAEVECISVLWGFKDREFLEKHGGQIFAETPKDIIKIVEKKYCYFVKNIKMHCKKA